MNIEQLTRRLGKYAYEGFFYAVLVFALSSCTSIVTPPPQQHSISAIRHDIYHTVGPLETVWRISKMYDVSPESVIKINNLNAMGEIKKGQRLLIPKAAPIKPVVTLYPSRKWKYIIVHHSATGEGNALEFDAAHLARGWEGIGYHFVIDNGTEGKVDGQIEVSPRWIRQSDGAHCKASDMNMQGIGICLVGNFNEAQPSRDQMESLAYLVNLLSHYYRIPKSRIYGHGKVMGAQTDCPGTKFPWNTFISTLKTYGDKR